MDHTAGAHPLFTVLEVEHRLALAGEEGQGQLDFPHAGVLPGGQAEPQLLRLPLCLAVQVPQGADGVHHELGLLLVPDGDLPGGQHGAVFPDISPALVEHPGETQQLHGGGVVLQGDVGHQGIVPGGPGLIGGDHSGNGDHLSVPVAGGAVLPVKVPQNGADGHRPHQLGCLPVGVHGVPGEVEAGDLLLHGHELLGRVLGHVRQVEGGQGGLLRLSPAHAEQVHLALQVALAAGGDAVQHLPIDLHQLGALIAHPVKGPGFDEALQHPPV